MSQQGIFKPAVLDLPISIRTTYRDLGEERPYVDEVDEDGYLLYPYRGTDPQHHENPVAAAGAGPCPPRCCLAGVAKSRYLPSAATIIEDHPESLTFGVQLMPIDAAAIGTVNAVALDPATRRHYLGLVQRRTGQARFREMVLDAYAPDAPSVGYVIGSCWMPPTSSPMLRAGPIRSATGCPSARSTMPLTTPTSWGCDRRGGGGAT